ncbi:hypothetical protein K5M36_21615 [Chromobacterium vaccinii]|nr:hypothetical protein [Chromobacterium vaccinii]
MDRAELERLAGEYIADMTSIRGRRVFRLIMRELVGFDHVVSCPSAAGAAMLLALDEGGRIACCRSNGKGGRVEIVFVEPDGAVARRAYNLLKDSLPEIDCQSFTIEDLENGSLVARARPPADWNGWRGLLPERLRRCLIEEE